MLTTHKCVAALLALAANILWFVPKKNDTLSDRPQALANLYKPSQTSYPNVLICDNLVLNSKFFVNQKLLFVKSWYFILKCFMNLYNFFLVVRQAENYSSHSCKVLKKVCDFFCSFLEGFNNYVTSRNW